MYSLGMLSNRKKYIFWAAAIEHHPETSGQSRTMPHRPSRRVHRFVELLPINHRHSEKIHQDFFIHGQIPPSEQQFNHSINRQGLAPHLIVIMNVKVPSAKTTNTRIFVHPSVLGCNLRQAQLRSPTSSICAYLVRIRIWTLHQLTFLRTSSYDDPVNT